jgi:hypothetical protein
VAIFRLNRDWRDAGRKATILEDHTFKPSFVEHEDVSWQDTRQHLRAATALRFRISAIL